MKWKKGAVRLKKIRVLIPALCMGLVLFGCGKEEKPVAAAPSQYKTADELIQEVEQKEKEESMSRAAQAFGHGRTDRKLPGGWGYSPDFSGNSIFYRLYWRKCPGYGIPNCVGFYIGAVLYDTRCPHWPDKSRRSVC